MNDARELPQPPAHGRSWLLAPALAGLFPVLALYVQNSHEATLRDALACGAVVVLIAVGLAWGLRYFLPSAERASIGAVWIVGWSFVFSKYLAVARNLFGTLSTNGSNGLLLAAVWVAILIVPLVLLKWFWRSERFVGRAYQIVTLASIVLIGLVALQAAAVIVRGRSTPRVEATAAADQAEPSNLLEGETFEWAIQRPDPARDIYFLVFDRYASASVLQRLFNYDNSAFYVELEKRGFMVERECLTCYPMTLLSMVSTLNMQYANSPFTERLDYVPPLERHEVGRLLIDAGYDYHHFGNSYAPLRKNKLAQQNMRVSFLPTEFADALLTMTPLGVTLGSSFKHSFVIRKFAAIGDLADDEKLTFAYAHFLVPHYTYVFSRDGSLSWAHAPHADKQAYLDQLIATNRLILQTVDQILARSKVKPIIILLADEGPYLMPDDYELSRAEQLAMRCGILSAVLIPDEEIAQKWPSPLAPVNIFRFLLREYFGAPLELLPGRVFYWENAVPTGVPRSGSRILDVTEEVRPAA